MKMPLRHVQLPDRRKEWVSDGLKEGEDAGTKDNSGTSGKWITRGSDPQTGREASTDLMNNIWVLRPE